MLNTENSTVRANCNQDRESSFNSNNSRVAQELLYCGRGEENLLV